MQPDKQAYRQKEKVTNVLIDQLDYAHHNHTRHRIVLITP
jgi:hypothetical protein